MRQAYAIAGFQKEETLKATWSVYVCFSGDNVKVAVGTAETPPEGFQVSSSGHTEEVARRCASGIVAIASGHQN